MSQLLGLVGLGRDDNLAAGVIITACGTVKKTIPQAVF